MHVRRRPTKPVFVDRSGRRRHLVRVTGVAGGLGLALAAVLLVAGFTGSGTGRPPSLPEPAGGQMGGGPTASRPPAGPGSTAPPPGTAPAPGGRSATPAPAPATTAAVASPAPSGSSHRRVPTHTPGNGKPVKPS
ncbi:hypothetical protein RB614_44150 [Phytohabitans sp. ZYX-F-186]|uniref:Uncharacterized protein n=1 Tax=Phytohabitans maris TaxID=3071409 RepID=A0ABU0ZYX8_9ACTN|nr:hypothetical protein [Phytohabitans sp. ZYX-F-186]MDQ7911499.1 hypothetical protein [Phytohabitans sp. ZYX-F-186]